MGALNKVHLQVPAGCTSADASGIENADCIPGDEDWKVDAGGCSGDDISRNCSIIFFL